MIATANHPAIKEKFSDNLYALYIMSPPPVVRMEAYRGDLFTFSIVGFNGDDTPFDFSVYDAFEAQLRIADPRNNQVLYQFAGDGSLTLDDEFVLGKTDESQDEWDELHIISAKAVDFIYPYPLVYMDIQGKLVYPISGQEVIDESNTFIKIEIPTDPDVTRHAVNS